MIRRFVVAICALSSLGIAANNASAQKGSAVSIKGKVAQVVPQGILVQGDDNKKYALGFTPKSKVTMSGTAGADYLAPGMFVQFEVDVDDSGKPTKEVGKLSITEQSAINVPGISSTAGPDAKPGAAGTYLVRGTVRANKAGTLTVAAGSKTMTVSMSGSMSIPVSNSNWQMAQPGDSISGDAQAFAQPNSDVTPAMAERIEIKAVMPIQKKKGR
ncbi:MAG: hypothetical protein C0483_13060 [Pirellula sp.]|nr:hypothetical protein [Pirellula sp.]